jgi:1,4-alpha-glucan branching enzyme
MKKGNRLFYHLLITLFAGFCFAIKTSAQVVSVSPPFPAPDQPITITYDATKGTSGLVGASSVSIHTGVVLSSLTGTTWSNVPTTWGNPETASKMTSIGNNKWTFTIASPRTYFNVAAPTPMYRIGMVFRESGPCGNFGGASTPCKEGKSDSNGDIFVNFSSGGYDMSLTAPSSFPIFKNAGDVLSISAFVSASSTISIKVNGVTKSSQTGTQINYDHTVAESGLVNVDVLASDGGTNSITKSFSYIVRTTTIFQVRPTSIKDGINYFSNDPTKATLSFLAPLKSNVYVVGDFNNWQLDPAYQMKKDGERFWIDLSGLTGGVEYAYQYLVDETLYVADPLCDKILDPSNDQFILPAVYPSLKAYPSGKANGIVSVLQTAQVPYVWKTLGYSRPAKEKLNIYELLIRDFDMECSYQSVINRLDYLKNLGINAIELMPIMEFSGNDSWGYNPIFYFAPDKAYGTKDKLKELIDKAHEKGMAVILDMVLNQADYEFPYVKMYWNVDKPAANNPWFNQVATHPFSVFFDFNHESLYTKALVDMINSYWITEYKFDGFRFDLSKGFTQTVNTDVGAWGNYDQSRVDILTRMANKIWEVDPTAYVILEHLGVDAEESVLANNGMMPWGIMHEQYKQNSIGFSSNSDIGRTFYKNRSGTWNNPASIVAYMESHDEERIMVDNIKSGNSSGTYSIKDPITALNRIKAAAAFLFSIPGPKMLWQFGELGYDLSINRCANGTIGNCRTEAKPPKWDYFTDPERLKLYKVYSYLLKLRNDYDLYATTDVSILGGTSLTKQVILKNQPYLSNPVIADDMNLVLVGNFDVVSNTISVAFPHPGAWFHYFSDGDQLTVSSSASTLTLQPGEFRLYTDLKLLKTDPELTPFVRPIAPILTSLDLVDDGITINWADNSTIETGYRIYRRKPNENFGLVTEIPANTTNYVDKTGLMSNSNYEYYVESFNISGNSISDILNITTSIITGFELSLEESISIYPNPVDDVLIVKSKDNTTLKVEVISATGVRFKPASYNFNSWDFRGVPAGLYILEINQNNTILYKRILKRY